jgi:hypothetical protein
LDLTVAAARSSLVPERNQRVNSGGTQGWTDAARRADPEQDHEGRKHR